MFVAISHHESEKWVLGGVVANRSDLFMFHKKLLDTDFWHVDVFYFSYLFYIVTLPYIIVSYFWLANLNLFTTMLNKHSKSFTNFIILILNKKQNMDNSKINILFNINFTNTRILAFDFVLIKNRRKSARKPNFPFFWDV